VKKNWIWCENERELWWLIFCFCCCQRSFRFRIGFSRRGINFSRHFVRRLILEFSRWNEQKSIDDKILHVMTYDFHQVTINNGLKWGERSESVLWEAKERLESAVRWRPDAISRTRFSPTKFTTETLSFAVKSGTKRQVSTRGIVWCNNRMF